MKILIKESDKLKSKLHKNKIISEYLIYLIDDNNKPLICEIAYGELNKIDIINNIILGYFTPDNWSDNKKTLINNLDNIIEEVSYDTFIKQ